MGNGEDCGIDLDHANLELPPRFSAGRKTTPFTILAVLSIGCFTVTPSSSGIGTGFFRILHPINCMELLIEESMRFGLDRIPFTLGTGVDANCYGLQITG